MPVGWQVPAGGGHRMGVGRRMGGGRRLGGWRQRPRRGLRRRRGRHKRRGIVFGPRWGRRRRRHGRRFRQSRTRRPLNRRDRLFGLGTRRRRRRGRSLYRRRRRLRRHRRTSEPALRSTADQRNVGPEHDTRYVGARNGELVSIRTQMPADVRADLQHDATLCTRQSPAPAAFPPPASHPVPGFARDTPIAGPDGTSCRRPRRTTPGSGSSRSRHNRRTLSP